jgi:hypothetical protein
MDFVWGAARFLRLAEIKKEFACVRSELEGLVDVDFLMPVASKRPSRDCPPDIFFEQVPDEMDWELLEVIFPAGACLLATWSSVSGTNTRRWCRQDSRSGRATQPSGCWSPSESGCLRAARPGARVLGRSNTGGILRDSALELVHPKSGSRKARPRNATLKKSIKMVGMWDKSTVLYAKDLLKANGSYSWEVFRETCQK